MDRNRSVPALVTIKDPSSPSNWTPECPRQAI